MAHELRPNAEDSFLEIGRLLQQDTYRRKEREITVELTPDIEGELKQAFQQIKETISQGNPPEPVKNKYCTKCAYGEFCWV